MKKIFTLFAAALMALGTTVNAATLDLNFDMSNKPSFSYFEEAGDWFLVWTDVTGVYELHLDYYTTEEGFFGTYTVADLDAQFSYLNEIVPDYGHYFSAGEFTIADEGNGNFSLTGTLTSVEGDIYNLNGYYDASLTALENTEVVKVQKTIENGQMIIIRDGKKYNAVGAEL